MIKSTPAVIRDHELYVKDPFVNVSESEEEAISDSDSDYVNINETPYVVVGTHSTMTWNEHMKRFVIQLHVLLDDKTIRSLSRNNAYRCSECQRIMTHLDNLIQANLEGKIRMYCILCKENRNFIKVTIFEYGTWRD